MSRMSSSFRIPSGVDVPVELENQFILRLPAEPAAALREAIRSGASNLRDRLQIQLEPDAASGNQQLRRGHVVFDGWTMSAKLMDLPTIIESHKTIDKKTFYKTADICQILICQEGEEDENVVVDDTSPNKKQQKKDPNKVDKKYIYRHGICPPLKNCRRRRFRKTLKKKFIEAPEIEKEVKRLLRVDNEAIDVKYDLVSEEDLNATRSGDNSRLNNADTNTTLDEQDLFGALSDDSDSNIEDKSEKNVDVDSEADDSTMFNLSGTEMSQQTNEESSSAVQPKVTQFSRDMFQQQPSASTAAASESSVLSRTAAPVDAVAAKLDTLRKEAEQLRVKKVELERNVAAVDNLALLARFKQSLAEVQEELKQKEAEVEDLSLF